MGLGAMASIDSSLSGNRPDYLSPVIEATKYLGSIELCPEAKPYAVLMFNMAVLSGLIMVADTFVSTLRSYGVNCELDSLKEATELLRKATELVKDRKATPEEALELTNDVERLFRWLTFDLSACMAMTTGLATATG
jgi:hypothetical protein